MTEEKLYVIRSELFAPGVLYEGADGSKRTVTAEAHRDSKLDGPLMVEKNHSGEMNGVHVLRTYRCPDTGIPMVEYAVTEDVRKEIKSKSFRGISPVIDATELHADTEDITNYELKGFSLQFDTEAACSKDKCATTFVGGETMTDEETEELEETQEETEEETAEEKPKKVVKKKVAKKTDTTKAISKDLDAMAKMARELEQAKAKIKQYEDAEKDRTEKRRKELLEMVDEDLREHAESLDVEALEKVTQMNKLLKKKYEDEAEAETVTEAGGEETKVKPKQGSEGEKTQTEETEMTSMEFFDKSSILKFDPPPGSK